MWKTTNHGLQYVDKSLNLVCAFIIRLLLSRSVHYELLKKEGGKNRKRREKQIREVQG